MKGGASPMGRPMSSAIMPSKIPFISMISTLPFSTAWESMTVVLPIRCQGLEQRLTGVENANVVTGILG